MGNLCGNRSSDSTLTNEITPLKKRSTKLIINYLIYREDNSDRIRSFWWDVKTWGSVQRILQRIEHL